MVLKRAPFFFNKRFRNDFTKKEIFFFTFFLFKQCNFTPDLRYYFFKKRLYATFSTKFRNFCLLTNKHRSIVSKIRLSRLAFQRKQNFGLFSGVFRSVW